MMRRLKNPSIDPWEDEWYEWFDELSEDSTMPIPTAGGARIIAGVFSGLGALLIVVGLILLLAGLQLALTSRELESFLNYFLPSALVTYGVLALLGGVGYLAIGMTINLIADMRVELAFVHRSLAAILQVNLRLQNQMSKQLAQIQQLQEQSTNRYSQSTAPSHQPKAPGETDPNWTP